LKISFKSAGIHVSPKTPGMEGAVFLDKGYKRKQILDREPEIQAVNLFEVTVSIRGFRYKQIFQQLISLDLNCHGF